MYILSVSTFRTYDGSYAIVRSVKFYVNCGFDLCWEFVISRGDAVG
jgi:hypothetical protein